MKEWVEIKVQSTNPEALFGVLYTFDCLGITEEKNFYSAYFSEEKTDVNLLLTSLNSSLQHEVSLLGVNKIHEENWSLAWQQYFGPQYIGKNLLILPPWISVPESDKNKMVITINPGMAFGTGMHPTTKMCLEFLEKYIEPQRTHSVLDVGCGSGILSIASRKLGANHIIGIDNSVSALEASWQNIAYNDVDKVIISGQGIEAIDESFDIVVANMLFGEILDVGQELIKKLNKEGRLILSGIIAEQENELRTYFLPQLRLIRKKQEGEWITFIFKRKNEQAPVSHNQQLHPLKTSA